MDFSNLDFNMDDPFSSLVTPLDDIQTPGTDGMDFENGHDWQAASTSQQNQYQGQAYGTRRPNQHSPPQEFYDPNRPREVGSIVSLLSGPSDDLYSAMRFSPPNFDLGHAQVQGPSSSSDPNPNPISNQNPNPNPNQPTPAFQPLSGNGPASMLANLANMPNGYPGDAYRPMSLQAQQLAAPAMQPPNLYVNIQGQDHDMKPMTSAMLMSPPQQLKCEPLAEYPSPPMMHQGHTQYTYDAYSIQQSNQNYEQASTSTPPPANTKEELLRMLANMSPSEVERLKGRKTSSQPSTSNPVAAVSPPRPRANGHASRPIVRREVVENFLDQDDDDDDSDGGDTATSPTSEVRKGPKTERRTAHNLIEKKYRCSINDRIQHLKILLAGEETKLSKSATLRRAIEHIERLEAENAALRIDVDKLRSIVSSNGLPYPSPEPIRLGGSSPLSDCNMASPISSPSPPRSNGKKRARVMTNGSGESSRVTMFAMLMAVLIFNPLGILTGAGLSHASSVRADSSLPVASPFEHSRVLEDNDSSIGGVEWQRSVIRPMFVWGINVFIVICVLMRLLVYGEPVQDFKSGSWSMFVSTREKARAEAESGNLREAQRQFCECLVILERPLPSPGLDAFVSLIWQCIRHLLNWLWIGRWLARRRRSTSTPVPVVCRSHAHTAVLYHDIHQLHLMGIDDDDVGEETTYGLYLALSAVNLAESAGASNDGLPRAVMAQIYVAAALRCRMSLPKFIAPIAFGYFMRRARRHIRRAPENTVSHLLWIFHPATRRYIADASLVSEVLSTRHKLRLESLADEQLATPLSRLRGALKVHLLAQLVNELAGGEEAPVEGDRTQKALEDEVDVVDISRLLVSMSTMSTCASNEKDETSKFGTWLSGEGDACCTWWTHVLTCGIYWRAGKLELARKHYSLIRHCPPRILKDNLGLSVGHALCARKICIDDRDSPHVSKYVCVHTRKALETLRLFTSPNASPIVRSVQEGVRRMAYEWIMGSLLDAWRARLDPSKPYWTQSFDGQQLFSTLYQEACNHYTIIHGNCGGSRLLVYELTSRMLNGANPQTTWVGVRRGRAARLDAVRGRVSMRRAAQPDAFHLHALCKLHSSMDNS